MDLEVRYDELKGKLRAHNLPFTRKEIALPGNSCKHKAAVKFFFGCFYANWVTLLKDFG
jgi:hypothetical protein